MRVPRVVLAVATATAILLATPAIACADDSWPARVRVTNDNGIDDPGIIELAKALAIVTETHVVAPATDQSGMSNLMTAVRQRTLSVSLNSIGRSASPA